MVYYSKNAEIGDIRFKELTSAPRTCGFGQFDVVISLEVVEHLAEPWKMAQNIKRLLKPGGIAIISTPYHSYLKNLTISLLNKWDTHLDPFWDGGHVKLWSRKTLNRLFNETGLVEIDFQRVGRVPPLAKSMIVVYSLPASQ